MPCHPARARELVRAGKAKRRFSKGLFYILLTERQDGFTQPVALELTLEVSGKVSQPNRKHTRSRI